MIVSSVFRLGVVQRDGRVRVHELHEDSAGGAHGFDYKALPSADHNAVMLARVPRIEEALAEAEFLEALDSDGWKPLVHQTPAQFAARLRARYELHDPVPQDELAGRMGQAGLMIMPSDYPEICSNSILQSLRSGTPVITTGNLGSAGQWIRNGINGFLTRWQPHDYMIYQMEIMRFAMLLLNDRGRHEEMISCAARTPILSWEQVGDLWEQALCS